MTRTWRRASAPDHSTCLPFALAAALLAALAACGGGSTPPRPAPPTIDTPPAAATVAVGHSATFTVAASGTAPLAYQWMRRAPGAASAAVVAGATGTSLTTPATSLADSGAAYSVVVTNEGGTATSAEAALNVMEPPAITSDPASVTVDIPQRALFTVVAAGSAPLTYRWTFNGAPLQGAVSASIAFDPTAASEDGAVLVATVSNAVGSVTSAPATLHVVTKPVITAQPQGVAVQAGQTATFTVAARGGQPLSFQWQQNGIDLPGATGASFTTPPAVAADANALFTVVVSNAFGAVTSDPATLTVAGGTPPGFAQAPADLTVAAGQPAAFSVVPTGDPAPTLQWRRGTVAIPGATAATFTLAATAPADDQAVFTVVATNPFGTATSSAARLTVQFAPQFTAQPAATTTVDTGQPVTFTAAASGQPAPTFQWFRNGAPIPGATSASLTLATTAPGDDGATFTVVATNALGQATSNAARLSVRFPPQIVIQPQAQVVNAGQTATFSATIVGNPAPTFQWRRGAAAIPGATATTFSLLTTAADDGASFSLVATNALGNATTTAAALTVRFPPVLTQQPAPVTVVAGQPATFTVAASGNPAPAFQWFRNGTAIPGQTGTTFTIAATAPTDDGASFTVTATNALGQATSSAALLTVQTPVPPTIVTPPHDLAVTAGEPASFSVVAAGTPPLGYQWQRDLADIPGATSPTFAIPSTVLADGGSSFRVVVSNAAGQVTSAAATLTVEVNLPPVPTAPAITVFELASATSQVSPGDPNLFQTWTYAVSAAPAHGTATVDASGLVTYTAAAGFSGADSVTVTVTDSGVPALSGAVAIPVTVNPAIALTVTANPDPAAPGDLVLYELKVGNRSTSAVSGIVLRNTTPNATVANVLASTGAPSCGGPAVCAAGTVVTWPAFTLGPGQVATLTLLAQIAAATPDATVVHDVATATYGGGTLTQTLDLTTQAANGLRLALEEDHDPVRPGDAVTYTLVLGNTGTQALPASGVGVLSAAVPPGTTFTAASPGGALAGGAVRWTFGAINPGAYRRFGFTVAAGAAIPGGTVLQALAQALDGATSLVRARAATDVASAQPIQLTVSVNDDPLPALGIFTAEYKVTNLGGSAVTGLVFADQILTASQTNVLVSAGGGACGGPAVCGPGAIVASPAFSLAPGQTQTFRLLKQVVSGAGDGALVRSGATVFTPSGAVTRATDLVVQNGAGLNLGLAEDHDPVKPGDALTYTVVLSNTAAAALPASGAGVLSVDLPAGTTFASASAGGALAGSAVRWTFNAIDPGASRRFTFTVSVGGALADGTVLQAAAQVLDGADSLARVQAAAEVRAVQPIQLTVTVDEDPLAALGIFTVQYEVTNLGSTTVSNLVFADQIVAGEQTNVLVSAGGVSCGGPAVCGVASVVASAPFSLAPGQTQRFRLLKQIVSGAADGALARSAATVASPAGLVAHDTDLVVRNGAGLRLGLEEDHDPVKPGDAITYTVVLSNTSAAALPASGTGVLSVNVPAGTAFASASAGGALAGGNVQWAFDAIDPGADRRFTFTVTAGNALPDGTVLAATAQVLDGPDSVVRAQTTADVKAVQPIQLSVSVDEDPLPALGIFAVEYKVSNLGNTSVAGLVLAEQILANAQTNVLVSTGGVSCGGPAVCGTASVVASPTFSLAPGQTQTFRLLKQVDSGVVNGSLVRSVATVAGPTGVVAQGMELVAQNSPGLRLGIEEDHDPVKAGDAVTYTLVLSNTGAAALPASGAGVLSVAVPAGATFASASPGGALVGGDVQWAFNAIDPGASRRFTVAVSAGNALPDGTVLLATAQVLNGQDSVVRARTATDVKAVQPIQLAVSLSRDPLAALGVFSVEYKVSNRGNTAVAGLVLSDQILSASQTNVLVSTGAVACGGPAVCGIASVVATPTFTLAAGQTATVRLLKQVVSGTVNGTLVRSAATVAGPTGLVAQGTELVVQNAAGLDLAIEGDHGPVKPGDVLTYGVTLGNTAAAALPASGAGVLSVALPAGASFTAASAGGALVGDTVRWSVGSVAAGAVQRFTFSVTVDPSAADGALLESSAQLLDGPDSVARAQTAAHVQATNPVLLTVTETPDPVAALGLATYTLTVTNSGATTLAAVVLSHQFENAAQVLLASSTGTPSCGGPAICGAASVVAWPPLTLAPGATQSFTMVAQAAAGTPAGTLIRGQARVSSPAGVAERGLEIAVH